MRACPTLKHIDWDTDRSKIGKIIALQDNVAEAIRSGRTWSFVEAWKTHGTSETEVHPIVLRADIANEQQCRDICHLALEEIAEELCRAQRFWRDA